MQHTVGGWFRKATPTPAPTQAPEVTLAAAAPRVYYAGTEGLKVYSKPSGSSKVVGELSLHEKVTRVKLERGYAYVESATSGLKGWVNNAQLIWRLPSAPTATEPESEAPPAPAAEEPQAPEVPETTATAAEPTATPTNTPVAAPPSPKATPGGVAPSIFNPY